MSKPRPSAPAPHPEIAAGGIRRTRHYVYAFIASLKDCGHQPEHVLEVLRELSVDPKTVSQEKP